MLEGMAEVIGGPPLTEKEDKPSGNKVTQLLLEDGSHEWGNYFLAAFPEVCSGIIQECCCPVVPHAPKVRLA